MQTQTIELDRAHARELWRTYRKHQHYEKPIDAEIRRAYQLLAQGRLVIKALESIKVAGVNEAGFPKLAIARADAKHVFCTYHQDGRLAFEEERWSCPKGRRVAFGEGAFPTFQGRSNRYETRNGQAIAPIIPLELRPKRGLANYHVLWEAEWTKLPPFDPYLLRRIGKADLWLVVAAWDLTEVERAALSTRIAN